MLYFAGDRRRCRCAWSWFASALGWCARIDVLSRTSRLAMTAAVWLVKILAALYIGLGCCCGHGPPGRRADCSSTLTSNSRQQTLNSATRMQKRKAGDKNNEPAACSPALAIRRDPRTDGSRRAASPHHCRDTTAAPIVPVNDSCQHIHWRSVLKCQHQRRHLSQSSSAPLQSVSACAGEHKSAYVRQGDEV